MTARSAEDQTINLFDHARERRIAEGERLKKESIEQVDKANQLWVDRAVQVGKGIAQSRAGGTMTADDIYPLMGGLVCREPRAMGAVMSKLSDAGLIEATDRTVKSTRPECHRRPIRVWRVL